MPAARILRLNLSNFRSYRAASLALGERPVVLVGPNGAGKTNILEAISFLAPGRGLRRATLDEVAFSEGDGSWAVSAEVEGALGLATLGTGIEAAARRGRRPRHADLPHRPRACGLGGRFRRASAHRLADAGDGRAVRRTGLGAAAFPRPAGAGGRRLAFQPRIGAGAVAALAQSPAGGRAGRSRIGSMRSSTRPPSSRSRSRRCARRPRAACRRRSRPARARRPPSRSPRSR